MRVLAPRAHIELGFLERPGIECVCASGRSYAWTRKQALLPARVTLRGGGRTLRLAGRALVDDTAAYYARHTRWWWSAGIGWALDGREVAWNLVAGVNDPPAGSERTVWHGDTAFEPAPSAFASDLSAVGELRFEAEAELSRSIHLGVLRSDYRQPLGRFTGRLPGGVELAEGYGVMERHDACW